MTLYQEHDEGISRRQLLRRSAIVGGSPIWTIPAVQSVPAQALSAQGSVAGNGAPSYVYVFYRKQQDGQKLLYVVKYGDGSANPATEAQLSNDEPQGQTLYSSFSSKSTANGYTRSMGTFDGATVVSTTSSLQVRIDDPSVSIGGWFMHDGSCKDTGSKFVSSATPAVGGVAVGPAVPTTNGGMFAWQKCKP